MRTLRNICWIGAIASVAVSGATNMAASDRSVHEIQVTASRYAFEPAEMQVSAGEPVRIVIRSKAGVHGFSIPKLKIDVQVPKSGEPVSVEFTAPLEGRYEIACSEFCGAGHGQMKAALISVSPIRTIKLDRGPRGHPSRTALIGFTSVARRAGR